MLMLDECANIAPLGDLPKLVAELGGLGITTTVILQSVAAARTIWGEAGERALRDLANITLVWGGQKDVAFLEEISGLAGEDDEQVESTTIGPSGRVSTWTARRKPVLPIWGHRQPGSRSRGAWCPPTSGPGLSACHPGARTRSCPIRSIGRACEGRGGTWLRP